MKKNETCLAWNWTFSTEMDNRAPLSRSYLQSLKNHSTHSFLLQRAHELTDQLANLATYKAKAGYLTMTWSPTPDRMIIQGNNRENIILSHDFLYTIIKERFTDIDLYSYVQNGYIYYVLDWS